MRKRKTPTAGGMADAKSALQIEELGHLKDGTPIRVMKQADAAHRPDQKRPKELSNDKLRKMVAIAEGSPTTDARQAGCLAKQSSHCFGPIRPNIPTGPMPILPERALQPDKSLSFP